MKKIATSFLFKILPLFVLLVGLQSKALAGGGIFSTITGSPFCPCASTIVNYSVSGITINAGNTYSIELSDASGSFASPIVIGSIVSTATAGSIAVTFPCNLPGGTGYMVRTKSSNLAYTGSSSAAFTITAAVTPSVIVTTSPNDTVCTAQSLTFMSSTTNGGPSPTYNWYVNGFPVGGNTPNFTTGTLSSGDIVYVVVTSNATCANPTTAADTEHVYFVNSTLLAGSIGNTEIEVPTVTANTDVRYSSDCDLMVSINPNGAAPVNGPVTVRVTIDNTVSTYATQPYVQRHFDIEPANNAANATAIVTLYAYQTEFDAYNTAALSAGLPLLPTGAVDNGMVRVTQFHGNGTAPANYPGPEVLITPTVSWDATNGWWVMSFPVTGFSGFYIHTAYGHPLDIVLSDITAQNEGNTNRVNWTSANEAGGDSYTLQHSINGSDFSDMATLPARGEASTYTYVDEKPYNGVNYYRVKVNAAGGTAYTKVVNATKNSNNTYVQVYPNPAKDMLHITYTGMTAGEMQLSDMTGRILVRQTLSNSLDMKALPKGIYMLHVVDAATGTRLSKMITKE